MVLVRWLMEMAEQVKALSMWALKAKVEEGGGAVGQPVPGALSMAKARTYKRSVSMPKR